jgi:hypothetical protein
MSVTSTTYNYDIEVTISLNDTASGALSVTVTTDTSKNPPTTFTGTFTPTGGTAVTCDVINWETGQNGVVDFKFTLTAANGDFPIKQNGGSFTYHFHGNENASGNNPNGNVNWPNPNLEEEIEQTVTWQSEATMPVEEAQASGQGAS